MSVGEWFLGILIFGGIISLPMWSGQMSVGEWFLVMVIFGGITALLMWSLDAAWREGHKRGIARGYLDGRRDERSAQERIREEAR